MKFDFAIGNPPYQEETIGENKTFAPQIYHKFMDAAYLVADKVELVHPSKFLFDSRSTPKEWNQKMLNDKHFKILEYESNAQKIFPTTNLSSGIVISYYDKTHNFEPIVVFAPFNELKSLLTKVVHHDSYISIQNCIWVQTRFNLNILFSDYPELKNVKGSDGKDSRFEKDSFSKIPVFTDIPINEDDIHTLGIVDRKYKTWKYIQRKYVDSSQENLMAFKVITSVSNGAAGNLGETSARIIGETVLGEPGDGYTRSFIGIGNFELKEDAINCQKYLRTKFARVMIGIKKSTNMLNPDVWQYVPLQDFTPNSDIDWTKSISEIDKQLYVKYKLSPDEIEFIETHVKEME